MMLTMLVSLKRATRSFVRGREDDADRLGQDDAAEDVRPGHCPTKPPASHWPTGIEAMPAR